MISGKFQQLRWLKQAAIHSRRREFGEEACLEHRHLRRARRQTRQRLWATFGEFPVKFSLPTGPQPDYLPASLFRRQRFDVAT